MKMAGGLVGGLSVRGITDRIRRRTLRLGSEMDWDPTLPGIFDDYNGCNSFRYGDIEDLERLGYTPYDLPDGSDFVWPEEMDEDDGDCTTTITTSTTSTVSTTTTKTCDVQSWPQACHNYVSVAKHWWASGHNPAQHSDHLLCPWTDQQAGRTVPARWNNQHKGWTTWLPKPGGKTCERDEYPFIRFIGLPNPEVQFMRV